MQIQLIWFRGFIIMPQNKSFQGLEPFVSYF